LNKKEFQEKIKVELIHTFLGYDASIKYIPSHILIPVGFEVARTSPWAVEKWNSSDLKT